MHRRIIAVSLLAATASIGPALAQQAALRDVLPEGTVVYVAAPDLQRSFQEMQGMPLLEMWHEPEVQDFFADAMKVAEEKWQEMLEQGRAMHEQGMMPFSPDTLLELRLESFALALTSLGIDRVDGEPVPRLGIVAHLDFGESASQWRQILDYGLAMMEQQAAGEMAREVQQVGDVELHTFVPPETDMSLNVAYIGDGLVVGSLKSEVERVLQGLQDVETEHSGLATSQAFRSTFRHLDPAGTELEIFVQPGPAIDFVLDAVRTAKEEDGDVPPELDVDGIARALEAFGLRSMRAIGSTTTYRTTDGETKSVSQSFVHAPEDLRKGVMAGFSRKLSQDFLRWVPPEVASFSAFAFDLQPLWDGLVGAVRAYDEEKADELLAELARHEEQLGISIEQDLLGSIGNQLVTWSMPAAAFGTQPEMAILLEVRDKDRLLATLDKISQLVGDEFSVEKAERRGITVYQIRIDMDTGGGFNPLDMFIPTFSFKDGWLVAGFSTGDVKRVFKRMDREDEPDGDIRSNPAFAAYADQIPAEGLSSISFTDWKAQFEGLYQLFTSLIAFVPMDDQEIPIDLALLPDVSTLTQHLYGAVSWSTVGEDGYHSVSVGPWGFEAAAMLGGAAGAGAALLYARESTTSYR